MITGIHIVTGAPGSGKTTTLQELLNLKSEVVAFDIDWLVPSVGELTDKSVLFDNSV